MNGTNFSIHCVAKTHLSTSGDSLLCTMVDVGGQMVCFNWILGSDHNVFISYVAW